MTVCAELRIRDDVVRRRRPSHRRGRRSQRRRLVVEIRIALECSCATVVSTRHARARQWRWSCGRACGCGACALRFIPCLRARKSAIAGTATKSSTQNTNATFSIACVYARIGSATGPTRSRHAHGATEKRTEHRAARGSIGDVLLGSMPTARSRRPHPISGSCARHEHPRADRDGHRAAQRRNVRAPQCASTRACARPCAWARWIARRLASDLRDASQPRTGSHA